jgi:hypothetical protein
MTPNEMPERINVALTTTFVVADLMDEVVARYPGDPSEVTVDMLVWVAQDMARVQMIDDARQYRFTSVTDDNGDEI